MKSLRALNLRRGAWARPRSCGFQMPAMSLIAWAAASAIAMPAKMQKKMFCGLEGSVGRMIGEAIDSQKIEAAARMAT